MVWILFDFACIAFFLSLVLTPLVRDLAAKSGFVDIPDGERKTHVEPIPRIGGVALMIAYCATLVLVLLTPYPNLALDLKKAMPRGLAIIPAGALVFFTGLLDDLYGLRPWQKMLGQVVASLWAYWVGFGVSVLEHHPLHDWLSCAITVVWLVGCSNALNLIDGMDGLAAGVAFFASLTTFLSALIHGHFELALVTAPLAAALLGFLRYNFNPASVFLGDCGALPIGFLLGAYGAAWSQKSATLLGMTAPLMALAIPLLDVALSIGRRFLRHQPIFGADRGHIHHRLLDQGLTPRRAALLLYGVSGLAAGFSLLQDLGGQDRFGGLIIVVFCGAAWLGVQHLGYSEFGLAGQALVGGTLRGSIDLQMKIQTAERLLWNAASAEKAWQIVAKTAHSLGFERVRLKTVVGTNQDVGEYGPDTGQLELCVALDATAFVLLQGSPALNPMALGLFGAMLIKNSQHILHGRPPEAFEEGSAVTDNREESEPAGVRQT